MRRIGYGFIFLLMFAYCFPVARHLNRLILMRRLNQDNWFRKRTISSSFLTNLLPWVNPI